MFKGNLVTKARKPAERCPDLNIRPNAKKPGEDLADIRESLAD